MFLKNVKRQLLKCSIYFSNFKIHSQYICFDFFGEKRRLDRRSALSFNFSALSYIEDLRGW